MMKLLWLGMPPAVLPAVAPCSSRRLGPLPLRMILPAVPPLAVREIAARSLLGAMLRVDTHQPHASNARLTPVAAGGLASTGSHDTLSAVASYKRKQP